MGIRSKRTDMMVGLFAFFGLAIMAALVLQFGGFRDRIRPKYEIRVSFLDGSGIFPGAPVRLGGRKVGFVADEPLPTENFQSVIIPLFIFSDVRIPNKSRISLATAGLIDRADAAARSYSVDIGVERGRVERADNFGDLKTQIC